MAFIFLFKVIISIIYKYLIIMKNHNILDEYLKVVDEYKQKYKKYIVFYQVGSFYELYSPYENDENLVQTCELLNIILSKKNKNIAKISFSNPHMAGIPCCALEKYLEILINNYYTVIVYNQYEDKKKIKRKLDKIYSISTYLDSEKIIYDDNLIMSIYIEYNNNLLTNSNEQFYIGLSIINLSTGDIKLLELFNNDLNKLIEDLNKEFIIYNPKEVIYSFNPDNKYYKELYSFLEKKTNILHIINLDNSIKNIIYQNDFFKTIFKKILSDGNILSPIETLDLEKYNFGRISLINLLKFVYNHDNTIVNNLNKPDIILNSKFLNLHNNSLYQLNILSTNINLDSNYKYNSLFDIINKTSTPLGKRFLKYNLTHPLLDVLELNNRYNLVETMLTKKNTNILYNIFEKELNNIIDIEKYHNKLAINKLLPFNYGKLNNSYKSILKLINLSKNIFKHFNYSILNNFSNYYNEYLNYFNINNLETFSFNTNGNDIKSNIFNDNIIIDIDNLFNQINTNLELLNNYTNKLSEYINNDKIEIKYTDRDGYFLSLTKSRANKLKLHIEKNNDDNQFNDIIFSNKTQNNVYLTSKYIKTLSDSIIKLNLQIQELTKLKYYEITNQLYNNYYETLNYLNYFVSYIDLIKSFSKTSYLNNYCKPTIIELEDKKSFIKYSEIRHPISELLHTEYNYVTNDITLDNNDIGYLLYGSNGVGKSTLMKAVGLNIILAQIGCYVSAKSMEYYPYSNLFTRIDHSDNLFKGLSSFESEILELKTILNYSNSNSLVLGDEILNSTENISAVSIISSSINYFLENNISFIFASHLHQIPDYIDSKLIKNLNISHLKMDYDPVNKTFIYNRKIFKGMPIKNYGLIVAKSLLNNNFIINNALEIQNKIMNVNTSKLLNNNSTVNLKKSKYNSKLLMTECIICKDLNIPESELNILETHHIVYQQHFEDNKCIIDSNIHIKKNQFSNLVNLCKFHHIEVHKNNIKINGWIKTSNGKQLDYIII